MKKSFTLSIPKPCSERWDTFTPTFNGAFCNSCSKEVVDLSKKSDVEIADFFLNKPAHTCGRFRPDQLKLYATTLPLVRINPGLTLLKAGVMSLLFLFISKQTSAQDILAKAGIEVVQYPDRPSEENITAKTERIIKGVVKGDYDHLPLPGVNVWLKGSTQGTVTDAEGSFEFHGDFKEGDVIMFTFIGFRPEEYVFRKDTSEVIEIQLILDMDVMGEVAVTGLYEDEPSGLHKWWLKVKGLF